MKIKNLFNVIMYSFLMIVPLVPTKLKLRIPLAADFFVGSAAIFTGFLCIAYLRIKDEHALDILKERKIKFLTFIIILFTVLSIFSVSYSDVKAAAVNETLRFLEYVFLFYIVLIIADDDFINRSLMILYVVMIIASIYGVVQFVFNISKFADASVPFGRGRVYSTFVNPNYWGAAVNLVIFYPIIDLIEHRGKNRWYQWVALGLFLFNLLFCYTRGSWLGFGIGLIFLCLIKYRKALISIPIMLLGILAVPFTRARFLSIFSFSNLTNSMRIKLWKTGLYMFKDHFWLGVGNGNYLYKYYSYVVKHRELSVGRKQFSVHNSYIKMLAELGIIGGVIFVAVYGALFYIVYRSYKDGLEDKPYVLAFLTALVSYFFQNFFNNLIFIPQMNVFIWIVAAIIFKKHYINKRR